MPSTRSSMLAACLASLLLAPVAHARLPMWPWKALSLETAGCGISHASGFNNDTTTHTITSGGITRYYAVYVPQSYDPTKATPLIFDYHGSQQTPYNQYDNSQYYADTAGASYLVIYPQGMNLNWQGAGYASSGVDDVRFTADLLAHVKAQYCVDITRVYASGKSNGGGFVDTLACSYAGNAFAAFAMAAAALYTDTSEADACGGYRRAVLETHGLRDAVIPYDGGEGTGGSLPSIADWVSWWGQRTCGSGVQASVDSSVKGYTTTSYSCGEWTDAVQHYAVDTLGHCWPSGDGDNFDYTSMPAVCKTEVLDFTSKAVAWFETWHLGNAPGPTT